MVLIQNELENGSNDCSLVWVHLSRLTSTRIDYQG
ncbi:MAG: hypothetical protein K0R47_845 [Brevibacillus sp.]|nr:hypothetical protein [Brevibacillus sp.]